MINIGNKRECFFDNFLIDEQKTTAEKRLNKPARQDVILVLDKPWEGKYTTFFCPVYAQGKWHLYYTSTLDSQTKFVMYAESDDALEWTRPNLGIVEFNGSKDNNIIFDMEMFKGLDFKNFDNFSVFYDENPACPKNEKYKMVALWMGHASLVSLLSEDGIHWGNLKVVTTGGDFDSQNRAFWSKEHNKYFCYLRGGQKVGKEIPLIDKSYYDKIAKALEDPERFLLREPGDGTDTLMRDVRVCESEDFINWSKPTKITTTGTPYQLYNNVVFPYQRAPHMFVGMPLRYTERKAWTKNYDELCGREGRLKRMKIILRFGLAVTDSLFMSSRDGYNFTKYDEAFITPPPENPESFVYGDCTACPALIEVPSKIPGAENEYMIIVRENFRAVESPNQLVKYTIRLDGFVSFHAGGEKATVVTKEFVYSGKDLYANLATSARGGVYFTLKSGDEEYTSCEMFGNSTNKRVRFEDDDAVARLSGKKVTLTMELFDCDVYSIKFE